MEKKYILQGLDCANCAQKIEDAVKKIPGVTNANVNFVQTELAFSCPNEKTSEIDAQVKTLVKKIEPDVVMKDKMQRPEQTHDHHHEENEKNPLWKIGITFVGLIFLHFISLPFLPTLISYLILYLLIGYDVVLKALRNILRGSVFDENFLMALATIGAFAIQEYPEAVAVMLFYQLGEYFQDLAVENSRKSIKEALSLRPDFAHVVREGKTLTVAPKDVALGETLVVKPGEKIPLDSVITQGTAYLDTAALTGESVPKKFSVGETVLSGMVNTDALLTLKVEKDDDHSTAAKILALVEDATSQKAPAEKFITKFANYYTPAVVFLAVLLASVPPLFFGADFQTWLYRALTFLVISCPCALVISVPLSFFAGIGGASKNGVLIKGSHYLEKLANLETVVFDKTGTLTKGNFALTQTLTSENPQALLQLAASLEIHSNHPIGKVLQKENPLPLLNLKDVKEIAGYGLTGMYEGAIVLVGNAKLLQQHHITLPELPTTGTLIHVAKNETYLGTFVIQDEIKPEAKEALEALKKSGVKKTVLLTGDTKKTADEIAHALSLDEVKSQLLPQDKVAAFEEELTSAKGQVAFVGDGMNDAPVLARADVGIAMGGLGSDAAIEASDVVIMEDKLTRLPVAIKIAKKTMKLVKENIIFALGVKFIVLILGALGIASMALAVFADVGVTLIAVLNALRALKK